MRFCLRLARLCVRSAGYRRHKKAAAGLSLIDQLLLLVLLMQDILIGSPIEHFLPGRKFCRFFDMGVHFFFGKLFKIFLAGNIELSSCQEFFKGTVPRIFAHEAQIKHIIEVDELRQLFVRELIIARDFYRQSNHLVILLYRKSLS